MLRATVVVAAVVVGCSGNSTGPNAHGVADVSMSPDSLTIAIGDTAAILARPVNATGASLDDTVLFWSTSDSTIAAVDQHGMVRAVSIGSVNIDASVSGVSPKHPARIVVVAIPVATVVIAPSAVRLNVGGAFQFTDTTKDAGGHVLTGRPVVWTSSDSTIATVDQAGLVLAKAAGAATIKVASASANATATVTVTNTAPPPPPPPSVARIVLTPNRFTITTHASQQVTAQALDANGHAVSGVSFVWTSKSGGTVATVDANGGVTGVAAGSDSVLASADGVTGGAAVSVVLPSVATVVVTPETATIMNSNISSVQLSATLLDARGNTIVGPAVIWSSDSPDVATVSSGGVVTPSDGGSHGTATIRATSEGKQGTASVTVVDGGGGGA
jgi:uncharacterized protein YjdB